MKNSFDPSAHTFKSEKFKSVVNEAIEFFIHSPIEEFPPTTNFGGSGVYGIYYHGKFPLYSELSISNFKTSIRPIYVGKAVPDGWRQGRKGTAQSQPLFRRLNEHSRSIDQTKNLKSEEFTCRFMVLDGNESDLVVPVEAELIRRFTPLWNSAVDGFGNHDPGKGRYKQSKSEWDVLHPGRKWAEKLDLVSPEISEITEKVRVILQKSKRL